MGDQHTHAREVRLAELAPHALVEAAHAIVCVGGALAVGDAVEEVAVVGALLPHALHLGGAWLEVAKVLLAETRLFEDGNLITREGRRGGVVGGEGTQDAFGGLAGAAVGRGEELERVVWLEQRAQLPACFFRLELWSIKAARGRMRNGRRGRRAYLAPAQLGELHAVVGDELVNVAVLVSL